MLYAFDVQMLVPSALQLAAMACRMVTLSPLLTFATISVSNYPYSQRAVFPIYWWLHGFPFVSCPSIGV
jgi:hypothetical protein